MRLEQWDVEEGSGRQVNRLPPGIGKAETETLNEGLLFTRAQCLDRSPAIVVTIGDHK
jgi:hypothetical protein